MSETPRTNDECRRRAQLRVSAWNVSADFARELERELNAANSERDEAQLQLQRIRCEISCRVEHGADSNGHLEAILAMLKKEAKP